MKSFEP